MITAGVVNIVITSCSKTVCAKRSFNIYSLSNFQIYNPVLLTIITMLSMTSL